MSCIFACGFRRKRTTKANVDEESRLIPDPPRVYVRYVRNPVTEPSRPKKIKKVKTSRPPPRLPNSDPSFPGLARPGEIKLLRPPPLLYTDFSRLIRARPRLRNSDHEAIYEAIITPYDATAFKRLLLKNNLHSHYPLLVNNLRRGFPLRDMPTIRKTIIMENHPSVKQYPRIVDDYITEEVAAGRFTGPFSRKTMETIMRGPFISSPFIVSVQDQGPGLPPKFRVCRNLSKETREQSSVNSYIRKESFPTRFDTAAKVAELVASAPPGTQACTLDIAKFHRTCPVLPHHKPFLVVQGRRGDFYVDHCHPFGVASASSNAGMIANAVVDIWHAEGVKLVLKYEDDLLALRFPNRNGKALSHRYYNYSYNRQEIIRRIKPLCVPWHDPADKGDPEFLFEPTYVGLLWNLPLRRVSLPERKRVKYLNRVIAFMTDYTSRKCSLQAVEKLHGTLHDCTFVYLEGRSYLPSLSNFMSKFEGDENLHLFPPRSVMADLAFWAIHLSDSTFYRQLHPKRPVQDLGIYVDASTDWGIGIKIGEQWAAFRLLRTCRDIGWLETLAIELLVYFLEAMGFQYINLLVHSDNQGTIGAVNKACSPNVLMNYSIRRTYAVLNPLFISLELQYIESSLNLADPLSRGVLGPRGLRLPLSFDIPEELLDVLFYKK